MGSLSAFPLAVWPVSPTPPQVVRPVAVLGIKRKQNHGPATVRRVSHLLLTSRIFPEPSTACSRPEDRPAVP